MNIKLEHPFLHRCHNIDDLLNNVYKFNKFSQKLVNQSTMNPDFYDPDEYKGDGFELFCEAFIKLNPVETKWIGIGEYSPSPEGEPGVDGSGIGLDGKIATVQCKFKTDNRWKLTANQDHLSNFTTISYRKYGVDPKSDNNLLILTSADGLHYYTKNVMLQGVRCVGIKRIRQLCDNVLFWDTFRELIKSSIEND